MNSDENFKYGYTPYIQRLNSKFIYTTRINERNRYKLKLYFKESIHTTEFGQYSVQSTSYKDIFKISPVVMSVYQSSRGESVCQK